MQCHFRSKSDKYLFERSWITGFLVVPFRLLRALQYYVVVGSFADGGGGGGGQDPALLKTVGATPHKFGYLVCFFS